MTWKLLKLEKCVQRQVVNCVITDEMHFHWLNHNLLGSTFKKKKYFRIRTFLEISMDGGFYLVYDRERRSHDQLHKVDGRIFVRNRQENDKVHGGYKVFFFVA